jgi:DNA-binding protein YbaB
VFGTDSDDAQAWVQSWSAQVSARASAAAELAQRVARITASGTGADGAVRVTVDGAGLLSDLRLDDRVGRLSGDDLAAEIMRAMRRAQASLADEVGSVVYATVGSDSETGRAVLDGFAQRFPPERAEDDRRPGESSNI